MHVELVTVNLTLSFAEVLASEMVAPVAARFGAVKCIVVFVGLILLIILISQADSGAFAASHALTASVA